MFLQLDATVSEIKHFSGVKRAVGAVPRNCRADLGMRGRPWWLEGRCQHYWTAMKKTREREAYR